MKENKYISLTHKKLTGEITPEELSMLSSLEASDAQVKSIEAIWDASKSYEPSISFDGDRGFSKFQKTIAKEPISTKVANSNKQPKRISLYVFIGFLLLSTLAFTVFQYFNRTVQHYAGVNIELVELPDGSDIYLSPGASIKYASGFGDKHRDLDLKGKAYFDVERNPDLQFNINMGEDQVSVLGTAFNLDFDGKNVLLEVNEGTVRYAHEDREIIVNATESIRYKEATDEINSGIVSNPMAFTWATNELSFNNVSLEEVFNTLEEYFKVDIVVVDKIKASLTECNFTSPSIKKPVLREILEVMAATSGVDYKFAPDGKTVSIVNINCK